MEAIEQEETQFKIIVSCDGGGTRGYLTVCIIEELFKAAGIDVFQYVDLFSGTSTGGIISIGKAMGKIKNKTLLDVYSKETNKIFKDGWFDIIKSVFNYGTLFDSNKYKELIVSTLGEENLVPKVGDQKCFVVSLMKTDEIEPRDKPDQAEAESSNKHSKYTPALFANYSESQYRDTGVSDEYKNPIFYQMNEKITAVDAIQYTSGIPLAFSTRTIDGVQVYDGGINYNNPVGFAFNEARKLYPDSNLVILSFGTGLAPDSKVTLKDIKEINDKAKKELDKVLELESISFGGIWDVMKQTFEVLKLYLGSKFNTEKTSHELFTDVRDLVLKNDKKAFFFRFDTVLKNTVSFCDTSADNFKMEEQSSIDLSNVEGFSSWAELIKKVIELSNPGKTIEKY